VNKHRARPNALDPTTSFRPNEQTDQFSPTSFIMRDMLRPGVVFQSRLQQCGKDGFSAGVLTGL